jgi:molybdopterin molybdotransferase
LGANFTPLKLKAPLAFDLKQKKTDRLNLKPVIINELGLVEEIPFNGSAHINALVFANALMEIQVGQTEIKEGELVYVRPL